MAEIINLRQGRKAKSRTSKEKQAAQNRLVHGRSKQEKTLKKKEDERASKLLDGHKRENDQE